MAAPPEPPAYSVFIPVLDEEAALEANLFRLMAYLEGLGPSFEIILGLNGCRDRSEDIARRLVASDRRLRLVVLPRRGPGAAFARAVEMAGAPVILTLDMDLSTELDFIPRALKALAECTVVVGSKLQARQERRPVRIAASGAYILLAWLFLGLPFGDYSLGSKAFRSGFVRAHRHLIDRHTAYVGNLVFAAHRQGLPVVQVPVTCSDRRGSRFNLLHEGLYRVGWLLRLFWRYRLRGRPLGRE